MNEDLATQPPIDGQNLDRPMIDFAENRMGNDCAYRHLVWQARIQNDPKAMRWTNDASDYTRRKP